MIHSIFLKELGQIDKYPRKFWNSFEHRLCAAKQCKSQKEYAELFPGACDKSKRINREIQYFRDNIFIENPTPKKYWKDYKHREYVASCCHSKTEYSSNYPVAYRYSCLNNKEELIDFANRFFNNSFVDDESKIYLIYVYLNYDLMVGYCGLTRLTINQRHGQHKRKQDRLYKLFVDTYNINIPEPIVVVDKLNRIEAQEAEDYYINYYRKQGFNMLNAGHTGKNVGSIGYTFKYNKEHCFECALKCTSIVEFRRKYNKEYYSSKNNNWLDNYIWLEKEKFKKDITYEEFLELAKTCSSITEFSKKYPTEIIIARKNEWLYDFFDKPVCWDYETCMKESKKYKTRSQFKKGSGSAYVRSIEKKWIDDFIWLTHKKQKTRTFETFLEDVQKYNNSKEYAENDYTSYGILSKMGLFWLFFEKNGTIKSEVKNLTFDSKEYEVLKEKANEIISIYHLKLKEKRKNNQNKKNN